MRTVPFIVSIGCAVALVAPAGAWAGEAALEPTPFQSQVREINADRDGFISALAEKWAVDGDERAVEALANKLRTIPLHMLVASGLADSESAFMSAAGVGPDATAETLAAAEVSAGGITPQVFPPPEFDTKLEYTAVEPCRVMDTRNWNNTMPKTPLTVPRLHAVEAHMGNGFGDIPQQGGDPAGCPGLPLDAAAYAVTVAAIAPGFPGSGFPGFGFAALLPWDGFLGPSNWTVDGTVTQPPLPAINSYNTYNGPGPYSKAATIVWDPQTDLISNTTIVAACDGCGWHTWLYTSGQAHFTLDVVGYFDETMPCDLGDLFNRGMCYEPVPRETPVDFYTAELTCAQGEGRLPIVAELHPLGPWGLNILAVNPDGEWTSDMVYEPQGNFNFGVLPAGGPDGATVILPFPPNFFAWTGSPIDFRCVHPAAD